MLNTRWRGALIGGLLGLTSAALIQAADETGTDSLKIPVGDKRFDTPAFENYEALYTSGSSTTGAFTLQVRKVDGDKAINLTDIIPMKDFVIVAQRRVNARTHGLEYSAGPSFSWGEEYVVAQMQQSGYDWVRVPIGGGEPVRMAGELENGAVVSDMFSPTLASLMPMDPGSAFQLPVAVPRKDQFVSSWWEEYRVLRQEKLVTPAGLECDCWVIEKAAPGGGKTHIWVARQAPFVFRRIRDVGGRRELTSDVLGFRLLER